MKNSLGMTLETALDLGVRLFLFLIFRRKIWALIGCGWLTGVNLSPKKTLEIALETTLDLR